MTLLVVILAVGALLGLEAELYVVFALGLTAFFAVAVAPWSSPPQRRVGRVLSVVLLAVPFIVYGLVGAAREPSSWLLPSPLWILALVAALVLASLPPKPSRVVGIGLLSLLALDVALGFAGRPLLPPAWRGGGALVAVGAQPVAGMREGVEGLRRGAPTLMDRTPLGVGEGPWLEPAGRGRIAGGKPWVMLLDGNGSDVRQEGESGTFLGQSLVPRGSVLELDAFDAAVILPGAWPQGTREAERWADDLAIFARRGGLLVSPISGDGWPEPLGRRLGPAATPRTGGETKPYGLGGLARVASGADARRLLEEGGWKPRVRTVFDAGPSRWERLARRLMPSGAAGGGGGLELGLLLTYALVAVLLDVMLRRTHGRLVGLALPVLAVSLGLVWTAPDRVDLRTMGFQLDLGGGGGRRVDAVLLAAGEGGWAGRVRFLGSGTVEVLGGQVRADGRIHLKPKARAWAVREQVAEGRIPGEIEDARGEVAARLVLDGGEPAPIRYGRVPRMPVRVDGMDGIPAWTLIRR